ncbi:MAG TPA: hypothetical protein VMU04_20145 [Candidatus Acidoferrum sp.]|nr:hypothetical protein [Candidatus Acidoferrum sp.]
MRTLLRNGLTGLYVGAGETWTCDPKDALDFKTMRQAIGFVDNGHLNRMEVAFESDDSRTLRSVPFSTLVAMVSVRSHYAQAA